MTPDSLTIAHEIREGAAVLRVRGELDLTTAEQLDAAIDATEAASVVLDLSTVLFVDSAAIRVIDVAHRRLRGGGRAFYVVAPPQSRAAWTFRVAGFGDQVVVPSADDAFRRLADAGDPPV